MNIFLVIGIIFTLFITALIYILFPRQTRNFIVAIRKRKKYVVCHLKRCNTDFIDIYNVVPESDKLTHIDNFDYNLHPKYSVLKYKGRLHFLLNEENSIPATTIQPDLVFASHEIRDGLNNKVVSELFTRKKDIMLLIMMGLSGVMIIVMLYTVSVLNKVNV